MTSRRGLRAAPGRWGWGVGVGVGGLEAGLPCESQARLSWVTSLRLWLPEGEQDAGAGRRGWGQGQPSRSPEQASVSAASPLQGSGKATPSFPSSPTCSPQKSRRPRVSAPEWDAGPERLRPGDLPRGPDAPLTACVVIGFCTEPLALAWLSCPAFLCPECPSLMFSEPQASSLLLSQSHSPP